MSLDVASVLTRRAEGVPELHRAGAADRLLGHLVATETDVLDSKSTLVT